MSSQATLALFALTIAASGLAQEAAPYSGPIIDMHMHAANVQHGPDGHPRPPFFECYPGPCTGSDPVATTEEQVLRLTLEAMDRNNIVLGYLSGYDASADVLAANSERVQRWIEAAPERFLASAYISHPGQPPIDQLRAEYREGKWAGMGEITTQYAGYRPNDPTLAPYFALAAELDVPAQIHTLGIGAPLPTFRPSAGNPLLLEDVLAQHPDLRLFVENCGFPFAQEWIAMTYQYPQLNCDISTITWIINRTAFHDYLYTLVRAGLSARIMFGTDSMEFPETIDVAVEAIQSAGFLTRQQKADIFYNNAARFLRLTKQQMAVHHK